MAEITATLVRQLREETNLPMMDCKQALTEAGGDKEKAKEVLRKKGLKIQEGRGGRDHRCVAAKVRVHRRRQQPQLQHHQHHHEGEHPIDDDRPLLARERPAHRHR